MGSREGDGGCSRCCSVAMVWVIWADLVDGRFSNDTGSAGEPLGPEATNWNVGSDAGLPRFALVPPPNARPGSASKIWPIPSERWAEPQGIRPAGCLVSVGKARQRGQVCVMVYAKDGRSLHQSAQSVRMGRTMLPSAACPARGGVLTADARAK